MLIGLLARNPCFYINPLASSDTDEESDAKCSPLRLCKTGEANVLQKSLNRWHVVL